MTVFDSHFAAAGFPMLIDQFGESVTYVPSKGALRSISAIVDREPAGVLDASGNAVFPKVTVRVYNSTTSGISSAELDVGADEMVLPIRVGDSATHRFSVLTLMSQDAGVTQLALT